jgi:hypothetical protein
MRDADATGSSAYALPGVEVVSATASASAMNGTAATGARGRWRWSPKLSCRTLTFSLRSVEDRHDAVKTARSGSVAYAA